MKQLSNVLWIAVLLFWGSNSLAQQKSYKTEITVTTPTNYLLYEPSDVDGKAPLLVFLHGGGESADNIELVKKHGPPKQIEEGRDFPFYVLSPQNPYKQGFWDDRSINALIEEIISTYPIDEERIFLAGLSRGGYGAWRLAMNYPERFAAMVVICGASAPDNYAGWIKDIPIWIFHGAKDQTIPVSESINMAEALKKEGAEVKLTVYPEADHDAWTQAFNNEEVYEWLLKHRKKN